MRAEGLIINNGRRVATAEGKLTDGKGRLLAHATTTCLEVSARERRLTFPPRGYLIPAASR